MFMFIFEIRNNNQTSLQTLRKIGFGNQFRGVTHFLRKCNQNSHENANLYLYNIHKKKNMLAFWSSWLADAFELNERKTSNKFCGIYDISKTQASNLSSTHSQKWLCVRAYIWPDEYGFDVGRFFSAETLLLKLNFRLLMIRTKLAKPTNWGSWQEIVTFTKVIHGIFCISYAQWKRCKREKERKSVNLVLCYKGKKDDNKLDNDVVIGIRWRRRRKIRMRIRDRDLVIDFCLSYHYEIFIVAATKIHCNWNGIRRTKAIPFPFELASHDVSACESDLTSWHCMRLLCLAYICMV